MKRVVYNDSQYFHRVDSCLTSTKLLQILPILALILQIDRLTKDIGNAMSLFKCSSVYYHLSFIIEQMLQYLPIYVDDVAQLNL